MCVCRAHRHMCIMQECVCVYVHIYIYMKNRRKDSVFKPLCEDIIGALLPDFW